MSTNIQAFCTFRIPVDIVFNLLFNRGCHPIQPLFINIVITRIKNGSPDMILTAFEGKFDEKQNEIPPGICRPHMLQNIQYWEVED